ncbi:MAG: tetratricopeptide repeat protein [Sedimentisphaerales bacterium]|nr:tetratricopeptide repeat protein [Sedimentisphaerales bacterium]
MQAPSEPPQAGSGARADAPPEFDDIFDPLLAYVSDPQEDRFDAEPVPLPPTGGPPLAPKPRLSLESVLTAGIICVVGALLYMVLDRVKAPAIMVPVSVPAAGPVAPHGLAQTPVQAAPGVEEPAAYEGPEAATPQMEPLSLQTAQKYYLDADYDNAFLAYDKLNRRLPATPQNQPVKDFLLLRMALCSRGGGNVQQADTMFRTVALSRLPVLRAIARYYQSMTLIDRQRYLEAAARAYQTIALIEVVDCDPKWSAMVQRQCCFLAAEALTRHLLSLQGADNDTTKGLWGGSPQIDPFINLDEAQLKLFLNSGRQTLDQALLGPQIRSVSGEAEMPRWSVVCDGAPLEELLARLTSQSRINVRWMDSRQTADEEAGRQRPVYLYLARATAQQLVTTAAGSVGLLAHTNEKGSVTIVDPSSYSSLAEYTKLLADESASLWQRFLLGTEEDQRVPNGHFALAMIHAARDRPDEAAAEYKLVASRFSRHALAPQALLRSGRLKVRLRDYLGAHEDFKRLVELYPDAESSEQACLELADVTAKAGLYEEAAGLYRKVFNLGLSLDSQIGSALGAGRCFHELKDHDAAAQWLNRYIMLARDQKRLEFHGACLLLGKTCLALNNLQQARAALNLALQGELSREQLVETFSTLARIYLQQGLFIDALNVLEGTQAWQLSQQEMVDLLLLRARALRAIGLMEKAIAILADKITIVPSPELKGAIALEMAECHAARGDLAQAIKVLGNTLALVQPGDLAQQIGGKLAELCLRADQLEQAISVCSQLLDSASDARREHLLKLQAEAYRRQKEYGRAVAALLSRYGDPAQWKSKDAGATTGERKQE